MGTNEVEQFLRERGFSDKIVDIFEDTTEVLISIDESDLKEFGLNFGERRKLALAIRSKNEAGSTQGSHEAVSQEASAGGTSNTTHRPTADNSTASQGQVAEIIRRDPKGEVIIEKLEKGNLSVQELVTVRRQVVQIITKHLTEKAGHLYPKTQEKVAMAQALVTEFPCFKDRTPGCKSYEPFYSEGEGFIEFRLKTMRQSAKRGGGRTSQMTKKKKNDTDDDTDQPSAEVQEQMEWLKYHPPTRENLSQIRKNLRDTFLYRRSKVVKEAPSITKQIEIMPRFRDMPDLINFEFDMLHPGSGSKCLVKWNPYFSPKLTQLSEEAASLNDVDVFEFLLKKLPTLTSKGFKSKGYDPFSFVMQHKQSGTDVEAFAKSKDKTYQQPFILALGSDKTNPTEFFIIVDNTSIPGGSNVVEAFDRLYKVHYIFNVHFARPLLTFFNFFDGIVYEVNKNIRPTVRELYSQMMQDRTQKED